VGSGGAHRPLNQQPVAQELGSLESPRHLARRQPDGRGGPKPEDRELILVEHRTGLPEFRAAARGSEPEVSAMSLQEIFLALVGAPEAGA